MSQLHSTPSVVLESPAPETMIRASNIHIDLQYQRPLNMTHVRSIAKNFDMKAFGVLLVSERADGSYWVIDGQHRLEAVRLRGDDELIPCHIYRGLSIADEATVFHMQTQRRAIQPIDRFRARLFAGDPLAIAIDGILRRHGLQVGPTKSGNLQAVSAVEHIYETHGEQRLDLVLDLIMSAISDEPGRVPNASLLIGVNTFISRYDKAINRNRLAECIRQAGMDRITRNSEAIQELMHESRGNATGRALLAFYNARLTTNRLPEWDSVNRASLGHKTRKAQLNGAVDARDEERAS